MVPPSSIGDSNKEDCNHENLLGFTKTVATLSQSLALGPVFHYYLTPTQVWCYTSGLSPPTSDSAH